MSQALANPPRMSVAEFIEMIQPYPDEERWELLDGEAVLMTPPTERHQRVVMNLLRKLDRLARRKGPAALPGLGLLSDAIDDSAPIPDVVVRCSPPVEGGYAKDPILVAEVLSPSTADNDRGRKLSFYRRIPTLRTILIAYPGELRVEAWQRDGSEWCRTGLKDSAETLVLPELDGRLSVAEVYRGLGPVG